MNILKKHRKFGLGLCLFLVVIALGFAAPRHTLALINSSQAEDCANNLVFNDIAHISCQVDGFKITLIDKDPTDNNASDNYEASSSKYANESTSGAFCQGNTDSVEFDEDAHFGIADSGSSRSAYVQIYYPKANGKAGCDSYAPNNKVDIKNTDNINVLLRGGPNNAQSLADLSGTNLAGLSYSRYPSTGAYDNPSSGSALFGDNVDLTKCSGSILAVYYSDTSGGTATEYDIGTGGDALSTKINLNNLPQNTCGVKKLNYGLGNSGVVGISPAITNIAVSQVNKKCTPGNAPDGYTCKCSVDGGQGADCALVANSSAPVNNTPAECTGDACSNSNSGVCAFKTNGENLDVALEWIICPVITGISKSADFINWFVAGQLNFDVNGNLTTSVKRAWAVFRDLVSSILVIILLIMVLSQAVSWGPFDAYTFKKLLPKLVVAIILMQISWYLCIWLIGLANDAGQSIGQLMAAPFGGMGNLDLPSLLHRFNPAAAGAAGLATGAIPATLVITGVISTGGILAFGWPILVLAIILILLTLVVALATLLIRNALIVILVMLSPVAFLAWILPGTQTYWKMWKDNFTRLLLFFPMVMAMIYGGRIFAWISANLGGSGSGPLDLIMVLLGFFGPYFFLPKTFKWGGNLLDMAAKGIAEAAPIKKAREAAKKELVSGEESAMRRHMGHYAAEYTDQDSLRLRTKNSLMAGRFIPTRRAKGSMVARGNAYKSKEGELEKAIQERRREKAASRTGNVMAGKEMDLKAISESLAKAAKAYAKGDTYAQKNHERVAKEAMRDLIATGSTLELNNEKVMDADGEMKFVWQTKAWADLLNGSPELYSSTKAQAPDWVPHRTPVGLPGFRGEFSTMADASAKGKDPNDTDEARRRAKLAADGKTQAEIDNDLDGRIKTATFRRTANGHGDLVDDVQWASSLQETVKELDAGNLPRLHPTYYERIGGMAEKGHELMQEAQRTGDTGLQEVAKQLLAPAEEFGQLISRLSKDAGGRQQLAGIMGGADTMEHLDYGLQFSGLPEVKVNARKGEGSMEAIMKSGAEEQSRLDQAARAAPVAPAAAAATAAAAPTAAPVQTGAVPRQVLPGETATTASSGLAGSGASLGENITVRLHDEDIGRPGNHIADAVSNSLRDMPRPAYTPPDSPPPPPSPETPPSTPPGNSPRRR